MATIKSRGILRALLRPKSMSRGIGSIILAFAVGWGAMSVGKWVSQQWAQFRYQLQVRHTLEHEWTSLANGGSRLDSGKGPAVLVEFSDYQCPFCRRSDAALDLVLQSMTVGVSYHHFPISDLHPAADGAARAAICAEEQGRFRQMHHHLMTTNEWQTDTNWVAAARLVGIPDQSLFADCLSRRSTTLRLDRDRRLADTLHVLGTPAFFTSTKGYRGFLAYAELIKIATNAVGHSSRLR